MQSSFLVLRAVTVAVLLRLIRTVGIISLIVLAVVMVLLLWLGSQYDALWYLGFILVLPLAIVVIGAWLLLRFIANKLAPAHLNRSQRKRLLAFSDTIFTTIEKLRFPYPVLLLLILKDVVRGKGSGFLQKIIDDSKGLRDEFMVLRSEMENEKSTKS